jgi:hypothetical protein
MSQRRAMSWKMLGCFFGQAGQWIGVLVYSGMFLAEDAGLRKLFAETRPSAGAPSSSRRQR